VVIRWREASREAVEKGEIENCPYLTVKDPETVLKDGPSEILVRVPSCILLLVKRAVQATLEGIYRRQMPVVIPYSIREYVFRKDHYPL